MPRRKEGMTSILLDAAALPRWGATCCAPTPRAAAGWARSKGLRAPPPGTMSWWILVLGKTKRLSASTTDRAGKIVAARGGAGGVARWRRTVGMGSFADGWRW